MGVIAVPLRTGARFRPWWALVEAFDSTISQPALWLLGTAGFLLRGGFIVVLLTIVTLPSPVEVRLWIGDGLGSTGFSGGLVVLSALIGVATAVVLLASMWALAGLELAAIERIEPAVAAKRLAGQTRRRVVSWIFVVQAAAFLVIGAATLPLIAAATSVAYQEILRPTGNGPLYERVVGAIEPQLLLLGVAIVAAEALSAIGTRTALTRLTGAGERSAQRGRWRPLVALIGWTATVGVMAPAVVTLGIVAHWTGSALLGVAGSGLNPVSIALAVAVLVAVWAAVLVLAGFASALRGALWTVQELR